MIVERDERERGVRRIQFGLIRSLNFSAIIYHYGSTDVSDDALLQMYGASSAPLAEALFDVMAELVNRGGAV